MWRLIPWVVLWQVLVLVSPVRAEEKMPPARLGTFLARSLTYDGELILRAGASLDIAVVYETKDVRAADEARLMAFGLKSLELTTILGLPVRVKSFAIADRAALENVVAKHQVDVLIVPEASEPWIAVVTEVSRALHVRTVGVASAQAALGIAMAFYLEEGKARIVINLGASRAEGAKLGVDLLRLSRVLP